MTRRVFPLVVGLVVVACTAVGLAANGLPRSASTRTIAASADAYTRYDAQTSNYGTEPEVFTSGTTKLWRHTVLKFHLPVLSSGETIGRATLRLYATADSANSRSDVYSTSTAWTETGVTWRNEPVRGGWLGRSSGQTAPRWISWDVTKGMSTTASNVDIAFRLESGQEGVLSFGSRENRGGHQPELVLTTTGTSGSPSPSGTAPSSTSPPFDSTQAAVIRRWGPVVAGDEFNYAGVPNRTKWNVYNSPGHAGNGKRRPSQVAVDGGKVRISGTADGTTGGMSAKFARQKYGRWEVRMRVSNRDPRYHPVLSLWPDSGKWPCDAEIDYAEGTKDLALMSFFHHYSCSNRQTHAAKAVDATRWHNYAVEWTVHGLVGYLDGVEWFQDADPAHQPPGPMHQTIQLDWFPNGTPTNPSRMDVDWVRVYRQSTTSITPRKSAPGDVRIAAVGDMNSERNVAVMSPSGRNGADIASGLAYGGLNAFFGLGDFQYSTAHCADYVNYWMKLWGGTKSKLYWVSAPNHDWRPGLNEDLDDFMNGQCPGDSSKSAINTKQGFIENGEPYSSDFGKWHVVFLSSALWVYDVPRARQVTAWLNYDLATAKAKGKYLAAVYHEPYFTSDTSVHNRAIDQKPWIDVLYKYRVRLTLSGSQHNYERSCPVDNADRCVADGMTAFQVSTGGVPLRPFTSTPPYIVKRFSDTHGWLELTLKKDGSFRWDFHPLDGLSTDSGVRAAR
jgi:hypothetical protein